MNKQCVINVNDCLQRPIVEVVSFGEVKIFEAVDSYKDAVKLIIDKMECYECSADNCLFNLIDYKKL